MFCFYTLLLELYYTSNLYNGKNKSVCKEMNMRCDASMMIRRASNGVIFAVYYT